MDIYSQAAQPIWNSRQLRAPPACNWPMQDLSHDPKPSNRDCVMRTGPRAASHTGDYCMRTRAAIHEASMFDMDDGTHSIDLPMHVTARGPHYSTGLGPRSSGMKEQAVTCVLRGCIALEIGFVRSALLVAVCTCVVLSFEAMPGLCCFLRVTLLLAVVACIVLSCEAMPCLCCFSRATQAVTKTYR